MSKITQLNIKNILTTTDIVPIIDSSDPTMSPDGTNKKISLLDLSNSVANLITNGTLDGAKIRSLSITAAQLSAGSITTAKLAAGSITADKIAAGSITADKIAAGSITADKIAAGVLSASSIVTNYIQASSINGSQIVAGTITATQLSANSITTDKLAANSITTDKLTANSITTINLSANSITTDKLAANSITTDKLTANSITSITIQASAITANKISAGAIASNSMLASNIIAANNLVTDFVLTKNIQSDNFNGQIINNLSNTNSITSRTLSVGTSGYYMDSQSGTIVASKFIARDGIIAGNYIKYNNSGGFAVDAQGNFGVAVDEDTLTVSNGELVIKQVPSTSIVVATQDINYLGGLNTTEYNRLTCTNPSTANAVINSSENIWCIYDSLSNVQSALNITSLELYNPTFTIDYSQVVNLAQASNLFFSVVARWSDSPTMLLNSPVVAAGVGFFTSIINPVLPLGSVTYSIPKISIVKTTIPTNRYLIIAPSFALFGNNLSGTVGISATSTLNTSLIIEATGQITSPNNAFSSLVKPKGLNIALDA